MICFDYDLAPFSSSFPGGTQIETRWDPVWDETLVRMRTGRCVSESKLRPRPDMDWERIVVRGVTELAQFHFFRLAHERGGFS